MRKIVAAFVLSLAAPGAAEAQNSRWFALSADGDMAIAVANPDTWQRRGGETEVVTAVWMREPQTEMFDGRRRTFNMGTARVIFDCEMRTTRVISSDAYDIGGALVGALEFDDEAIDVESGGPEARAFNMVCSRDISRHIGSYVSLAQFAQGGPLLAAGVWRRAQ